MSLCRKVEPTTLLAQPWQAWEHLAPLAPDDVRRLPLAVEVTRIHHSFTQEKRHKRGRTRRRGYSNNNQRHNAA